MVKSKDINKEFIIDDGMIIEYAGSGEEVIIPYGVSNIFF